MWLELVYTLHSKCSAFNGLWVRIPPSRPCAVVEQVVGSSDCKSESQDWRFDSSRRYHLENVHDMVRVRRLESGRILRDCGSIPPFSSIWDSNSEWPECRAENTEVARSIRAYPTISARRRIGVALRLRPGAPKGYLWVQVPPSRPSCARTRTGIEATLRMSCGESPPGSSNLPVRTIIGRSCGSAALSPK